MSVVNEQRRRVLITAIRASGRLQVSELAEQVGVSIETVRRDLAVLEQQGFVRRTHGAVHAVDNAGFESSIDQRASHMVPEKRRIAEATAQLVGTAATSVFLDDGFTPRLVGELLAQQDRALTVITPSLPLAISLTSTPRVEVILLGGRVRGLTLGTVGHWATKMLEGLVLDLAVLGTNGISVEHGTTTPSPEVSAVKTAVMAQARRCVLVGVHTKFGTDSFARFAQVQDFETLITDRGLSTHEAQRYSNLGPRVLRA